MRKTAFVGRRRARFPGSVYEVGEEPDPRFSLANERTFLAWARTGLALLAAGVALEALALPLQPDLRLAASLLLLVLGTVTPGQAWRGWVRNERAMRQRAALPSPTLMLPLAAGCALAGILVVAGLLTR